MPEASLQVSQMQVVGIEFFIARILKIYSSFRNDAMAQGQDVNLDDPLQQFTGLKIQAMDESDDYV